VDLFPYQQISFLQERPQQTNTDEGISFSMMDDQQREGNFRYLLCDESAATRSNMLRSLLCAS